MTDDHFSAERPTILFITPAAAPPRTVLNCAGVGDWRTITVPDLPQASAVLKSRAGLSAIVLDACASAFSLADAVIELKKCNPAVPVVVITDDLSSGSRVQVLRAGASDSVARPVTAERLLRAVKVATAAKFSRPGRMEPFTEKLGRPVGFGTLLGDDPVFRNTIAQAGLIASRSGHVLIEGERGTGKNTLAAAIHASSSRADRPLKGMMATGMSERAHESSLFGHERNAFVGAFEGKQGILQQCHGGTLVLNDVDRLTLSLQERLAHCLSTRLVRPCGASGSIRADVRIIALSRQSLERLIAHGRFSRSLFALLCQHKLCLPPLRNRGGDMELIAHALLEDIGATGGPSATLTSEAVDLLHRFDWPKNISQLQAVLMRAIAASPSGRLRARSFPDLLHVVCDHGKSAEPADHFGPARETLWPFTDDGHVRPLAEVEGCVIELALTHYGGRVSEVARRLKLGRATLYRKMAALGIKREIELQTHRRTTLKQQFSGGVGE